MDQPFELLKDSENFPRNLILNSVQFTSYANILFSSLLSFSSMNVFFWTKLSRGQEILKLKHKDERKAEDRQSKVHMTNQMVIKGLPTNFIIFIVPLVFDPHHSHIPTPIPSIYSLPFSYFFATYSPFHYSSSFS